MRNIETIGSGLFGPNEFDSKNRVDQGIDSDIPGVVLYSMDTQEGREPLVDSLSRLPNETFTKDWTSHRPDQIVSEAKKRGILGDNLSHQLRNASAIGIISENDAIDYQGNIVEYPWKLVGRYGRILKKEDYYNTAFSRNRFVISDAAQESLRTTRFGIAGLGVGRVIGNLLGMTGAEHFVVLDGGVVDLKDFNRQTGTKVQDIDSNQAQVWTKTMYEFNPYCNITAYPKNLGEQSDGKLIGLSEFLGCVDIAIEAVDSLNVKYRLREYAQLLEKQVEMGTDLGLGAVYQGQSPDEPIFGGRLTNAQIEMLQGDHIKDRNQMTSIAMSMVGPNNIPEDYISALRKAHQAGVGFWPQPGIAAFLSAAMTTTAILMRLEGLSVKSEAVIDLRKILSQ